jgi:hypothetical protein
MKTKLKVTLWAVLLLLVSIVGTTATRQKEKQSDTSSSALKKAEEDFYTVADYSAPEPADPKKRTLRQLRSKRYNMRASRGVDPKRFAITEYRESSFGSPSSHAPIEPALPAAQSDAIVIGEVTDAQAFLTEDKTSVMSEFSIHLTDALKENPLAPFSIGDSLNVIRAGGAVRFSSGKVIRYGHEGKPLPRLNRQYLFFLKYNDDGGGDYLILTAYELREGHIFPLDGLGLTGNLEPAYSEYQKYTNLDESRFRREVFDAIARNLGVKPEVTRP